MAPKRHLKSEVTTPQTPKLLLPIILSVLKSTHYKSSIPILKQCSTKLLHFLDQQHHSSSPLVHQSHLNTILALLPLMLSHVEITATVAKIVGSMSLLSIEVNQMIAEDEELLKGICLKIVSCDKRFAKKALINALLDVSITSFGRQKLVQLCCLHYVMLAFLQVKKSMGSATSIMVIRKDDKFFCGVEHSQEELPFLLLCAAVTLTNYCNFEQLQSIPRKLKDASIPYWKEVWSSVRGQLLAANVVNDSRRKGSCLSMMTAHNLAECIFRLSMYDLGTVCVMPSEAVTGHIFGPETSGFKRFMSENWESSPCLLRKQHKHLELPHDIFNTFMHLLTNEESVPGFLSSQILGMVSCPPVALDEIDCLKFLMDVKDTLGCPVKYQQDIRVVKASLNSSTEKHYFQEDMSTDAGVSRAFCLDDMLKCEGAYREGYTVAIRGIEYRDRSIASITNIVASLFGQPSVGANLYVTPPNSQGLACHYDDHCVFVCQLRGTKEWTVFSQPVVSIPRLYEHFEVRKELLKESRQIVLREGDVLYIPRGFAHEACTISDLNTSCSTPEFSAHLTLAIEVERPFEWEGFAHVALHRWSHGIEPDNFDSEHSMMLKVISVNALHVAIMLVSRTEPLFQKACLVAARSLPPETKDWLDKNQNSLFNLVIRKIKELANFKDALNFVKMAVQRNEDPFYWVRWLEHLNGKEVRDYNSFDSISTEIRKILLNYNDLENAEKVFACLKSKFCSEILFDDAKQNFKILHELYKVARLQYKNGMLSLHF